MSARGWFRPMVVGLLAAALAVGPAAATADAGAPLVQPLTERASVGPDGVQADDDSVAPSLSADGRLVAFDSGAANLVDGDTNGVHDIFLRDRAGGSISRVSVASNGEQADAKSWAPSISSDGRIVAFVSAATNLVAGDTNGVPDVFVRDLERQETVRVSWTSGGAQPNGASSAPAPSTSGRYVVFVSAATNLVAGDTNGVSDVFVRDRTAHTTKRVSVGAGGAQAGGASSSPALSSDARFVAFVSAASNLVSGDTNRANDVFVRDRSSGTTARISVTSSGGQANGASADPAISGDGRFVAFGSTASNVTPGDANGASDVFVRDRTAHATARQSIDYDGSKPSQASSRPRIATDGRQIAFLSSATELTPGRDANGAVDGFVRDRVTGATFRVDVSTSWAESNGPVTDVRISPSGWEATFATAASNLVTGDTNGVSDVFVRSPLHVIPASLIGTELSVLPVGDRKLIALTFDCGGNADGVASILATLAREGLPATFFMTGRWTEVYPGQAAQIAASYPVGDHTFSHADLTTLPDAGVLDQIVRGRDSILAGTGFDPHPLFRFPFGASDARTIRLVNRLGYAGVRWSIDTLGWKGTSGGQSVESVLQRVLGQLRPGGIVLMHVGSNPDDGSTLDADALPRVIAELRARGYSFTSIDPYV